MFQYNYLFTEHKFMKSNNPIFTDKKLRARYQSYFFLIFCYFQGRGGLGSIYVFATGNGGLFGDSCAFDGYVNNVNTIPIGPFSKNGGVPRYAEPCSSVMAAAYGDYVVWTRGISFQMLNGMKSVIIYCISLLTYISNENKISNCEQ